MKFSAKVVPVEGILPWRDLYRQEMKCQIVHDSLHSRNGWTESYLLTADEGTAGYGSVAVGGPWKEQPALFEFYALPRFRPCLFDLFGVLLAASRVTKIDAQSNDPLLAVMLHTFARDITSESILFHDELITTHRPPGAKFRSATPKDLEPMKALELDPEADWVVEIEGNVAAAGDILLHYNRPYGDIYMKVGEPFRKRGLGSYLVQELKRVGYDRGSIPAARCTPTNIASRKTLQKAGFVPCGHILNGLVAR